MHPENASSDMLYKINKVQKNCNAFHGNDLMIIIYNKKEEIAHHNRVKK